MNTRTSAPSAATGHWTPEDIGDLTGRTAFITGGDSGSRLGTARGLPPHRARGILAGRDQGTLGEAAAGLRAMQPDALVDTAVADLGSLESIAAAASRLAGPEAIDLLFNNAGVMNVPERRVTADGFELTFGTNHL